jgi:hypothetical protein
MVQLAARHFGAMVEPAGITLVEYRRARGGVRVLEVTSDATPLPSIHQAAAQLGSMIELVGARRATVAVALRGFGSTHLTLTLPPASDDVLRPIVYREVRRASPDLEEPVFAFNNAGSLERRNSPRAEAGSPPVHLLVSAVPSGVDATLRDQLAERGVTLTFLTVTSHVLQRLYHELDGSTDPTAILLCLPGGPLVGYFLDGQLRMTVEAPVDAAGTMVTDLETILERVERGSLYLRQQFRGVTPSRFLVSAPPGGFGDLADAIRQRMGVSVLPFATGFGDPSAVAAVGAALDVIRPGGVSLLPYVPGLGERVGTALRRSGVLPVCLVAAGVAATLWAGAETYRAARLRTVVQESSMRLSHTDPALAGMRTAIDARRTATEGVASLTAARKAHTDLQHQLVSLARTVSPGVQLDSLGMALSSDGWRAGVSGHSSGSTGAQAVHSLDTFYRGIPAQVGASAVQLDWLDYVTDSTVQGVVVRFRLSFVAPLEPIRR